MDSLVDILVLPHSNSGCIRVEPQSVKRITESFLDRNRGSSLGKCVFGSRNRMCWDCVERHVVAWKRSSERDRHHHLCAVHEKWNDYEIHFKDTHHQLSQCVSSNVKRTNRNRSLRSWSKMSVSRTGCVLTHKRSWLGIHVVFHVCAATRIKIPILVFTSYAQMVHRVASDERGSRLGENGVEFQDASWNGMEGQRRGWMFQAKPQREEYASMAR